MKKLYGIEYDNGEPWEDGYNCALDILFKSEKEAIDYIKNITITIASDDYDDGVAPYGKTLKFNKKDETSKGETRYYLEKDPDANKYYGHTENGFYKVLEFKLQD
ncbi:hypothetical protein HKO22_03190 [Peptoniphilus sp. AGMB00490]|uniref:Uncharacterized protein n=1 Tax=Peptoniphilus faecalis TaxID=2731255 RepID=A0A848RH43_9FIRM|nr:hypothetical protein [Peptoniphilus faecalis]NMW84749.1 hypothetical protein [Peptoniphilus faecalis]